ncbi:MAG: hypothetical protein KDD53_09340 [Bdellovibrionales bacterium]|nr:hypothetical protein [Bdellovibrionales bacterium]
MRFLQLFLRYTPGLLVVQTRSPLIVLAMPVLKRLGEHASVTMAIETNSEEVARKYTPNLPKVSERLQAARALRRFGVEVTLQVAPLLPYGDWRAEAGNFAELLVENSDFLSVRPLISKSDLEQRRNAGGTLAKALARDRKFHWLRPDAAIPVIEQIERLAPEKLHMPLRKHLGEKQLNMFAA